MRRIIILLILILLYLLYINNQNNQNKYENFDNFAIWNNSLTNADNLDDLASINKSVNYNLTQSPLYNTKEYNASVWHLRFKNLVNNRYAYDDTTIVTNNDTNDWNNGNNDNNCHANNCDNNNCHGVNCYEKDYAILRELPTCQDNKNCPVDKLY